MKHIRSIHRPSYQTNYNRYEGKYSNNFAYLDPRDAHYDHQHRGRQWVGDSWDGQWQEAAGGRRQNRYSRNGAEYTPTYNRYHLLQDQGNGVRE